MKQILSTVHVFLILCIFLTFSCGYVNAAELPDNAAVLMIINADTEMMDSNTANAQPVMKLDKGTYVIRLANKGDWSYVQCEKQEGYVESEYLSDIEVSEEYRKEFGSLNESAEASYEHVAELKRESLRNIIYIVVLAVAALGGFIGIIISMIKKKNNDKQTEDEKNE